MPSASDHGPDHGHDHGHHHGHVHVQDDCCAAPVIGTAQAAAVRTSGRAARASVTYRVDELDCATEERELREALADVAGITGLEFDLVARRVTVQHDEPDTADLSAHVEAAIRGAGMRPTVVVSAAGVDDRRLPRRTILATVLAGVAAIGAELVVVAGAEERSWPVALLALVAVGLGGRETLRKGAQALRHGRLTMSLLMSVAVIGAAIIGQWPEAAVVIWLFGLAELIEALSLERARHAIRALVELAPETATVRSGDDWTPVATDTVALGATVLVRPGERVPLDGVVAVGTSTVDQAPITGESVPVTKTVGDQVFAGTINQRGSLEVTVTATAGSGTLDRIAASIQDAQSQRAPAQRFVDRFAAVYTPIVFVAAIVVAVVPPLLDGGSFRSWLYKALVLLVLACPCALVISTPVTVVSGLGGAARRGILIKGGVHLENARRIRTIALDKTGTLTVGRPQLVDLVNLSSRPDRELLQIAASIEAHSEHPVAHAITAAFDGSRLPIADVEAIPGRGIVATVDGVVHRLGNHALVEHVQHCSPELEARLVAFEAEAKTAVVLMDATGPLAILTVADDVKPTSVEAVADLVRLGISAVMLTGDNQRTASAVAARVGIDDARGDLLPDDKLAAITDLVERRGPVAMIGDGVNDAPALARADLGIAMGAAGTDTAIETADVALMDDDPRKIAELVRISAHTAHVLWQNITLAIGIKAVFLGLTLAGHSSLWLAVLADMGTSLLVIANGLRLLRHPAHGTHAH
ncbi:MAG: heavy metal translocating P-type ATPase [Acidimicrobiales bacterium]